MSGTITKFYLDTNGEMKFSTTLLIRTFYSTLLVGTVLPLKIAIKN